MIAGHLKHPANTIFIESMCSSESSALEAWICPERGHVELQATHPKDLAHQDIPDEDLRINQDTQRNWDEWEENP
ncbi:MAG: hypothetical protein JXA14_25825 [Anaerolineae bacterium]|nr:hypothetical protein [Anaerolineae bacterium]